MVTVFTVRDRIPVTDVPSGSDIILPGTPVTALRGVWPDQREGIEKFSWVEYATAEVPAGYIGVVHRPPSGAQGLEPVRMSIRANPNLPVVIDV